MTRFAHVRHLVSALALTGAVAVAAIAACGSHPGTPGEMPPVAPRPDPIGPGGPGPTPPTLDPSAAPADPTAPLDAGLPPGPVSSVTVRPNPTPRFAPVVGEAARDAGTEDSYTPPLPPLPDGGLPADSRLEPRTP